MRGWRRGVVLDDFRSFYYSWGSFFSGIFFGENGIVVSFFRELTGDGLSFSIYVYFMGL